MANQGDEFVPKHLPKEDAPNYFNVLVDNCITAFRITLSDVVALDANGVIGKLRPMILDDPRYKSETKIIRAKKTIDDLSELKDIQRSLEYEEDDEDEEVRQEFDIRNKDLGEAPRVKKPKKLFDKTQIDLKMKIFQAKRDLLAESKGEEEKEGDAINYFFVPITRDEFEKLKVVEISDASGEGKDAYKDESSSTVDAYTGKDSETPGIGGLVNLGSAGRIEMVDGEEVMILGKV